jgi:hypothetical protein
MHPCTQELGHRFRLLPDQAFHLFLNLLPLDNFLGFLLQLGYRRLFLHSPVFLFLSPLPLAVQLDAGSKHRSSYKEVN